MHQNTCTYTILGTNPEATVFAGIQNIWCAVLGLFWLSLVATNDRLGVAPATEENLNDWLAVVRSAAQCQMGIICSTHFEVYHTVAEWIPMVFECVRSVQFC